MPYCFGAAGATGLPGPVLVELLGSLGVSAAAARSSLHRLVGWGLLGVTRVGRVAVYRLAGQLAAGFHQVQNPRPAEPWSGWFHVLVYDIPETRRRERDQLRQAAYGHGYRQLRPGVLISPTDRSTGFLLAFPHVIAGRLEVPVAEARTIVERCWDTSELAQRRAAIAGRLAALADQPTPEPREAFALLYEEMTPAVALLIGDSMLPADLTTQQPTADLSSGLARLNEALGPAAAQHAGSIVRGSGLGHLVETQPR